MYTQKEPLIRPDDPRLSDTRKCDPSIRALITDRAYDRLEETILSRIEEEPDDPPYFLPLLRALEKNGLQEQVQTYTQLLLDALEEKDDNGARVAMMVGMLKIWPQDDTLRTALIEVLRTVYADVPDMEKIRAHCNVGHAPDPVQACSLCEQWLRYDTGTPVHMETKGVGEVYEINLKLGVVRTKFLHADERVSLRLDEAQRLLTVLFPGDFLYDLLYRRDMLTECAQSDPGSLLQRVFTSQDGIATGARIKKLLKDIVPDSRWSTWWKKARSDPRITPDPQRKNTFVWNDSTQQAEALVRAQFSRAPVATKLDILRSQGDNTPALKEEMKDTLVEIAANGFSRQPSLSLEIALTLEKQCALDHTTLPFRCDEVWDDPHAAPVIAGIENRNVRKYALEVLQNRSPHWQDIYTALLERETDMSCLDSIFNRLHAEQPDLAARCVDKTIAAPLQAPRFFVWICTHMCAYETLKAKATWTFLSRLLDVLGHDTFKADAATLRETFDPGGAALYTIGNLDTAQARQLKTILARGVDLEEYRISRILHDIDLHHDELNEAKKEVFYVTGESIERTRTELQTIVKKELPENAREIKRTREYGDLRENFEYHAARARHESLSSRAKTLSDQLEKARAIVPENVKADRIALGTRVQLHPVDSAESALDMTILGPWDSDSSRHIYSYQADAIATIIGAVPGDTVTFNGREYTVGTITVWNE